MNPCLEIEIEIEIDKKSKRRDVGVPRVAVAGVFVGGGDRSGVYQGNEKYNVVLPRTCIPGVITF